VLPHELGQVGQHLGQAELPQGGAVIVVDQIVHVGDQEVGIDVDRARPVQQDVRRRLRVPADDGGQEIDQLVAAQFRQPANHAEIQEGDAVVRQIEQVAVVRVGMEKAVQQDHLEHGIGTDPCQGSLVQPGRADGVQIHGVDAFDVIQDADPLPHVLPVHSRNDDSGVGPEVRSQPVGVAALVDEIELAVDRKPELAHDFAGAQVIELGKLEFDQLRQLRHQAQVRVDGLGDAGPADLDYDVFAAVQLGAVHLGDRGGGDRPGVERREHLVHGRAQVPFELRPQRLEGERRHPPLKVAQFLDPFRRQQVDACGQNLPELDEARSHFLEGAAHAGRQRELRLLLGIFPCQGLAGLFQDMMDAEPVHGLAESEPDQD